MIKQINISNMDKLKEQMERALSDGYTHVIPYSNEIQIHQSMICLLYTSDAADE